MKSLKMRSSTNFELDDIKTGASVYLDSNIIIYDATDHLQYGKSCRNFLKRIEMGEISAITSSLTLTETLHKLIIIDLCEIKGIKAWKALRLIKDNPKVLGELREPYIAIDKMQNLPNLKIVSLTPQIAEMCKDFVKTYLLMSNDSVHLATMQTYGIKNLASNDSDFERVDWINLYKPKKE